jgi:hypothetical protein
MRIAVIAKQTRPNISSDIDIQEIVAEKQSHILIWMEVADTIFGSGDNGFKEVHSVARDVCCKM